MDLLGFSQIIDIAFVLVVTMCCWSSLSGNSSNASDRKAAVWKRELEELRKSLEQLIAEASTASRNLDKNLSERQAELSALLEKIERSAATKPNAIEQSATLPLSPAAEIPKTAPEINVSAEETNKSFDPDLPNPSWGMGDADASADTAQKLADAIEVSKQTHTGNETKLSNGKRQMTLQRKRDTDPMAERVARRLLEKGQEIHIVARKLEMSLSEVRRIDREIRESLGETVSEAIEETSFETINSELESLEQALPNAKEVELAFE